jgi:SAM-dependent methyltransferase
LKLKSSQKHLIKGIASFAPGVNALFLKKGTGGTDTARYCYSVWLRHLVMAKNNGLKTNPKIVAELGPGDSLGIGLAALISGCDKYYAFDIINHTNDKANITIFDELVELFNGREPIPGEKEFPRVKPYLESYTFPADILDNSRMQYALEKSRLQNIRSAITSVQNSRSPIQFQVPWYDAKVLKRETVDMIYSQAVLEHVDELRKTYGDMRAWLKPDGFLSHQIDFSCHGTADEWNGHWAYSDVKWKLIHGRRPYLLNREPHSTHIGMLKKENFSIVCDLAYKSASNVNRNKLALKFKLLSDEDLVTSAAFIQAVKS